MKKTFCVAIIAVLVLDAVDARKTRRNKRPKNEEDFTPQPNVVTYSTFGFNDVGSYDGFVPSSPDYANYVNTFPESSTRLYAPAFPTAMDAEENHYGSQDTRSLNLSDDESQASILQYPHNSVSFYNTPNFEQEASNKNFPEEIYGRNAGEVNSPGQVYGTKIGSKTRGKHSNDNNETEFNVYGNGSPSPNDDKFSYHEVQSTYESKPSFTEPPNGYQNSYNNYGTAYPSTNVDAFSKSAASNSQDLLKFPKVIDFTQKIKQYYPTELHNKYNSPPVKPSVTFNSEPNIQNENKFPEPSSQNYQYQPTSYKNPFNNKGKESEDIAEKDSTTPMSYQHTDYSQNYVAHTNSKEVQNTPKFEFDFDSNKDKFKYRPWGSTNFTNDYKNWKNPIKGYQYSTNYSNMNFEFDISGAKKAYNSNVDEVVPASSNIINTPNNPFPESDYSNFKKIPGSYGQNDDYGSFLQSLKQQEYNNKYDPEDYVRSLYSTVPTTTTQWGNIYKTSDFSSYKYHPKRPQFADDLGDDVVHIPKRPYGTKFGPGKFSDSKPNEWSSYNSYRPHKPRKPASDWTKEVSGMRYKTEEDLLGLRTHDTSHPSYIPTYRPSTNSIANDYDYKKLVERWRQSYLKAKYKDIYNNDFESYASEQKPLHVPVPKPYPIEVPHPVIVPVPQPYPVRVPIPKPVAIPIIHELTIPIEKPVPYPVYKKVPYPVEKPVPVPVEKEVQVPVMKPYPVPVPHIRPVFHHSRPREEIESIDEDEDDYMPRPESSKRIPYAKRPRGPRTRPRRPSRPSYYDRNRRRWPARRPTNTRPELRRRRPANQPQRHHEDEYDRDSEYLSYCKRTGNC